MTEVRRKFYQEDLSKYFLVEYLQNSVVDPSILQLLDNYDITQDPAFSDKNVKRRVELHSHFFDHGFPEDRRVYAALCSPEMGYGAFADVYIPAWTVIGEYTGIITDKSANTDYAWIYHSTPKDAAGNQLKLRVNGRTCGNMTRFLNHSDYPNCSVIHVPYKNRWRTLYLTNSKILPDQELTVYYGEIYWKDRSKTEEIP
jgi:SET domain-containing protein